MRRPHLLTLAGRAILASVAQGYHLTHEEGSFLLAREGWAYRERVNPLTVLRLLDAGHIERAGATYAITAVGKAALEATDA